MKPDTAPGVQRLTRHSGRGWRLFVYVLAVALVLLAFEVAKLNLSATSRGRWPWKLEMLGVGPTSAVVLAVAGWLVARDQYGRSVQPMLRGVSYWTASPRWLAPPPGRRRGDETGYRQVVVKNTGPGVAVVRGLRWSLRHGDSGSGSGAETPSIIEVLADLDAHGYRDGVDFVLANYSPGTSLEPGEERLYFECTKAMARELAEFAVVFEFESSLGDVFERVVPLLPRPGGTEAVRRDGPTA